MNTPPTQWSNSVIRAVIVDDEVLAREALMRKLKAHPNVIVVGEAANCEEARRLLVQGNYDLVYLDINLRGGSGFELVGDIRQGAHLIFVTAYESYAIRAFEVNALDYLLKPINSDRLAETLTRITRMEQRNPGQIYSGAPVDDLPLPPLTLSDRVFVRGRQHTQFVAVEAIGAIRSCENYTELLLITGETILVHRTLASWETALPNAVFVRIHRQLLINLHRIEHIYRQPNGRIEFFIVGRPQPMVASRRQIMLLKSQTKSTHLHRLLP